MNWCLCPGTKAANVTKKVRSILLVKISMMMVHTSVSMEEGPSHLTDPVHPSDTPVSSGEVTIPTMNDSIDRVLLFDKNDSSMTTPGDPDVDESHTHLNSQRH